MKKRSTNKTNKVNGYYIKDVEQGFWGEQGEGNSLLEFMGLPRNMIPFSTATFLQERKIRWKDKSGHVATMSFRIKPEQIEFYGSYLGKKKNMRMFREWGEYEDKAKVAHLESEAIGNLCMMCIFDKTIGEK